MEGQIVYWGSQVNPISRLLIHILTHSLSEYNSFNHDHSFDQLSTHAINNYFFAFPQAYIKTNFYMQLPKDLFDFPIPYLSIFPNQF